MSETTFPVDPEELASHADRLRALARRLVADDGRADDVVQETQLVALTASKRAGVPLYAWLAGIARNVARRERRTAARRGRRETIAARPEAVAATVDVVERAEFARVLVDELVALDEPYRRTLLLRFFDGLAPHEIAARTGVPDATVRSHLKRGLELLRERLDARHKGDRRAWLAACAPFLIDVRSPGPATATAGGATAATGVMLMASTKTIAAGAAVLLLVGGLAWVAARSPGTDGRQSAEIASATVAPETAPAPARGRVRTSDAAHPESSAPASVDAPAAKPAGRVTGRVVLPDGAPAVGAAVRLSSWDCAWVETDRDGRFTLDSSKSADRASVWVVASGYRSPPVALFAVARASETTVPDIRLEPDVDVVLRGRLRSKANRSVEGGRVKLWWGTGAEATAMAQASDPGLYEVVATATGLTSPPPPAAVKRLIDLSVVVGADGRFALALLAALGRACLSATAPGHLPGWGSPMRLADVGGAEVEIALAALPRAKGQVVDAVTGAPVAGAGVGFFIPERETPPSTTDGEGRFDVEAKEGTGMFAVCVVAKGYLRGVAQPRDDDKPLRVAVWPARPIAGRVELPDGKPVAGAYVTAHSTKPRTPGTYPEDSAYTDADGKFEIARLTDGEYDLTASMGDQARTSFVKRSVDAVRGGTVDVRIVVDAGLDIAGRVVDAAGAPVKGVVVYATHEQTHSSQERTDARGAFVLRGLPAGAYTVYLGDPEAAAGGWLPAQRPDVAAGATGLTLEMRRGETITGRLVDDDGHAVGGRRVVAAVADTDPFVSDTLWQRATTDGDGRFTLPGLSPGDVRIQMDRDSLSFDPRWWLVGGERVRVGSRDVRLVLTQGATITGELVDASGAPIPKSSVHALWFPSASGGRSTITDDRGRFEIRSLPPGRTYTIASVNGRVRDVAAGTRDLRLVPQK